MPTIGPNNELGLEYSLTCEYRTVHRDYDAGEDDVLYLGGGVSLGDLAFHYTGVDLQIGIKGEDYSGETIDTAAEFNALTDRVTIKWWNDDKNRVETLRLNDGTELDLESLVSKHQLAGSNGLISDLKKKMADSLSLSGTSLDLSQGTSGADVLSGLRSGSQRMYGMEGDDVIYGGLDGDYLDGGAGGGDEVSYFLAAEGVTVNLSTGRAAKRDASSSDLPDTISGFENVEGSAHDDILTGNSGANRLTGGKGVDLLYGQGGDDVYVYNEGDGYDSIWEGSSSGGSDKVEFGAGIEWDDLVIQAEVSGSSWNTFVIGFRDDGYDDAEDKGEWFSGLSEGVYVSGYVEQFSAGGGDAQRGRGFAVGDGLCRGLGDGHA